MRVVAGGKHHNEAIFEGPATQQHRQNRALIRKLQGSECDLGLFSCRGGCIPVSVLAILQPQVTSRRCRPLSVCAGACHRRHILCPSLPIAIENLAHVNLRDAQPSGNVYQIAAALHGPRNLDQGILCMRQMGLATAIGHRRQPLGAVPQEARACARVVLETCVCGREVQYRVFDGRYRWSTVQQRLDQLHNCLGDQNYLGNSLMTLKAECIVAEKPNREASQA